MQGVLDLLGADKVDMAVEPARGQDAPLAGDGLGAGTDDDIDTGLRVGVPGFAEPVTAKCNCCIKRFR